MIIKNENPVFKYNNQFLDNMDNLCINGPGSHFRVCLHKDDNSPVHEMIIRHEPGAWVAPHFHMAKAETFVILSGRMRIYLFSPDVPEITDVFDIEPCCDTASQFTSLVHLEKGIVHSMEAIDNPAVFLEIIRGPFVKHDHLFNPQWYSQDKSEDLKKIMDQASYKKGLQKIIRP